MPPPKLIVILGPTATGKSYLAVILAKKLGGEVISAESRQVYKGLNIGTGKVTRKEMKGVKHHLLDVISPKKQFSVDRYRTLAEYAISDIISRNKVPILCGGTGFYIDTVVNGAVFPKVAENPTLRRKLEKKSAPQLLAMLKKLDPKRAKVIAANNSDRNNPRRLIRAIEVASEVSLAEVTPAQVSPPHEVLFIGLNVQPDELKKRIRARLLKRIKAGMIGEAKSLHEKGLSWKRMEQLGLEYRYLALLLQGKIMRDEMIEKLDMEIRRYAKRQMTWFKRNKRITWFDPKNTSAIKNLAKNFLTALHK